MTNIKFVCKPHNRTSEDPLYEVTLCANEMSFLLEEKYGSDFDESIEERNYSGHQYKMPIKSTTTKKIWQTKETKILYDYYVCRGDCSKTYVLGHEELIVSYTPNSDIFKVKSDIFDAAKDKI